MQVNSIQAIVVLGAGVTPAGEPTPTSTMRTNKAVELMGLFPKAKLIMSGNAPIRYEQAAPAGTEAAIMRKKAVLLGVDPRKILVEDESRDTLSNVMFAKKNYLAPRRLHNVIVVTSSYHIPRAEYVFHKVLGPNYNTTFVSAGGTVNPQQLSKEKRSLDFVRALLDTAADGDDNEIRRRVSEWLHPYAKRPRFTLEEWYAYTNDGKPLPEFPDYT